MSARSSGEISVFAPAKINLYLHITGKRNDDYHTLDSLVAFADIGDRVTIDPARDFGFDITGPYAGAFSKTDLNANPDSSNLVIKALWAVSRLVDRAPDFHITLEKNLPLAAGIGGGSADAAAMVWALMQHWDIAREELDNLLLSLGADVPVCLSSTTQIMRGIGEDVRSIDIDLERPIVLVNPNQHCNTAHIFKNHVLQAQSLIASPKRDEDVMAFLETTRNDLTDAAIKHCPEIENVLNALKVQDGARLVRMSGSGATCFALFDDEDAAENATKILALENPDWWVKSAWLGQTARY